LKYFRKGVRSNSFRVLAADSSGASSRGMTTQATQEQLAGSDGLDIQWLWWQEYLECQRRHAYHKSLYNVTILSKMCPPTNLS